MYRTITSSHQTRDMIPLLLLLLLLLRFCSHQLYTGPMYHVVACLLPSFRLPWKDGQAELTWMTD